MHSFQDIIRSVTEKLKGPLPGLESQLKMTSRHRFKDGTIPTPPDSARPGSVLLLLYPVGGIPYVVFIKRPDYQGVHSGQISFPGGQKENSDRTPIETALRETEEEIGVDSKLVRVMGMLTPLYIPPSNFLVSPVVGCAMSRPEFRRDPVEVDEILELPLSEFFLESNRRDTAIQINEVYSIQAPCYCIGRNIIWGATAMMMSEFIDLTGNDTGLQADL